MTTSRIEIDLAALDTNVRVLRGVLSGSFGEPAPGVAESGAGLCAVVKQGAYGFGASRIARRLAADEVSMFAVYSPDEAREVLDVVPRTPVMILMPVRSLEQLEVVYRHAATGRVHLTAHDQSQLTCLKDAANRIGARLPLHVCLDTGMARGGALPQEARRLVESIDRELRLELAGLMTHFASSGSDMERTQEQARAFKEWLELFRPMLARRNVVIHVADSEAVFRSRRFHGSMARVGKALYGFAMEGASDADGWEFASEAERLRHVLRWTSSIVHETEIPEGWPVGYGGTWRAERRSRIALVPVGYADGYPRDLGNSAVVGLTGRTWVVRRRAGQDEGPAPAVAHAPVVGRISMDQLTIDVTDVPRHLTRPGSEVELVSREPAAPNALPKLAAYAGRIIHDMLCGFSTRVPREYEYPSASSLEAESSSESSPDRSRRRAAMG